MMSTVDQAAPREPVAARQLASVLGTRRYAGVWVLALMLIVFSVAASATFPTSLTLQTTLADSAITGLLALGMMLPLVTGIFDLSIASISGFAMVLASWLNVRHGLGAVPVCVVTLLASCVFGAISAVLVTRLRVNSLVTTLGVSTVALGVTELLAGGNSITPQFGSAFEDLGRAALLGIPLPFLFVLVIAGTLHYVLEHTTVGRRLQATGGNPVAARLAGVRVRRLQAGVLLVSALMGGFTGLVLAAKVGVATDSTAPGFLLPAVAALFLGATQIKEGANAWGTVLGVLILATGIKGLQLLGAAPGVADFFSGAVLLVAVAIAGKGAERLH